MVLVNWCLPSAQVPSHLPPSEWRHKLFVEGVSQDKAQSEKNPQRSRVAIARSPLWSLGDPTNFVTPGQFSSPWSLSKSLWYLWLESNYFVWRNWRSEWSVSFQRNCSPRRWLRNCLSSSFIAIKAEFQVWQSHSTGMGSGGLEPGSSHLPSPPRRQSKSSSLCSCVSALVPAALNPASVGKKFTLN